MLVLPRGLHESVVIGDAFLVTVIGIQNKAVDLAIKRRDNQAPVFVTLDLGETWEVGLDVQVSMVGTVPRLNQLPKARLGLQGPPSVSIHRKEVWDAIHGK